MLIKITNYVQNINKLANIFYSYLLLFCANNWIKSCNTNLLHLIWTP